jgi:dTMP kinase
MSHSKGIFVTCEGGEGVGKSSFQERLLFELKERGIAAIGTREPGGSPVGEAIRPIFNHPPKDDPLTPEAECFLVSAARIQHVVSKIEPNLQAGKWVICDRFADSSLVYQGVLGGLNREFLDLVIHHSTYNLSPHTTFLLDCSVDISLSRIRKRQVEALGTRYDRADRAYHIKIREAYLTLAKEFSSRYVILDAQKSTESLVKDAIKVLEERSAFVKTTHIHR